MIVQMALKKMPRKKVTHLIALKEMGEVEASGRDEERRALDLRVTPMFVVRSHRSLALYLRIGTLLIWIDKG